MIESRQKAALYLREEDWEKIENYDICRQCGGRCCKKCGCDYSTLDFDDLSYKAICEILSEGKISIVSAVTFDKLSNGKTLANLFLYLRARNVGRDVVDLISMKTRCSQLTDSGCSYSYEDRPTGGKSLVPVQGGKCYPAEDLHELVKSWIPYQNVLRKVVKRYTGKSVENKAREDVENLFYRVFCDDFDGVMPEELADLRTFVPLLKIAYPDEVKNAYGRYKSHKCNVLNTLQSKK